MILQKQGDKEVYSDTKELETEMLKIAEKYPEDLSEDFIANDNRYTVNNTFSSVRRNLLNWYHFKENASVLEVGAGMGALTGCLCDMCKKVVSLEMSESRSEVIKKRYPNRKNLEVVCNDIFSWESSEKFDYVVVVGVLEYAGIFGKNYSNPFKTFLSRLKLFLKENGAVLLAIENRFGLKYWCGGAEDHLCEPFKGIAGYQDEGTAVTFSKNELLELFKESGFHYTKFYYILPDYKFPTMIYTDDYVPTASAIQKLALNYVRGSCLIYDEKQLYKDIIDNHVEDFFANSFLVEASLNELVSEQPIYVSGKGECKKEYRVSTLIYKDGRIEKIAVHQKAHGHLLNIKENESVLKNRGIKVLDSRLNNEKLEMTYHNGMMAEKSFHQMLSADNESSIIGLFENLEKCLIKSSDCTAENNILWELTNEKKDYGYVLKNGYIDMTLSNCFVEGTDLVFFDQEWMFHNIPVKFIIFYAARQSYLSFCGKTQISLNKLYELLGIKEFVPDFILLERYVWDIILYRQEHFYDGDGWYNQYNDDISLTEVLKKYKNMEAEYFDLKQIIEEKNQYMKEIEKELNLKNQHIAQFEKEFDEKNLYIEQLEKEFNEKNSYIIHLEEVIKQQNEASHRFQLLKKKNKT